MNLPEKRRAAVSGGEIAYVDVGEGPTVVLLHGFPTSSYLWRREAWLFAQRMRVVAPDLLGYGDSEKGEGLDLSERAQAGYVKELLEQLRVDEVALVGHDIGGGVAQLIALDPGDLAVRSLVLMDTVAFDAWPIEAVRMLASATPEQETEEFVRDIVGLTFDIGVAHQERLDAAAREAYLRPWLDDPAALFRAARGITGEGLAGRDAELAALDLPAFLLWGEDDPFVPPDVGERLNELLPGSTLALLPGCSHFVNEDAPQTVGPLVHEWLRSRYLRTPHAHAHAGVAEGPVQVFLERPPDRVLGPPDLD